MLPALSPVGWEVLVPVLCPGPSQVQGDRGMFLCLHLGEPGSHKCHRVSPGHHEVGYLLSLLCFRFCLPPFGRRLPPGESESFLLLLGKEQRFTSSA